MRTYFNIKALYFSECGRIVQSATRLVAFLKPAEIVSLSSEISIVMVGMANRDQTMKNDRPGSVLGVMSPYPMVRSEQKQKYSASKYVIPSSF